MTSRTDPFPTLYTAAPGWPWQRLAFSFLLTLLAIVAFAGAFAFGYARVHDGRIVPGVEVNGISLSGLEPVSAEALLRAELPSLSGGSLTVRLGQLEQEIPYASFERDYDFDYMLRQAFELGRAANPLEQLQEQVRILMNGASVEPVMSWNAEQLTGLVAAAAAAAEIAPTDAAIERIDGRYVVTPATTGLTIDVEEAVAQAMAAVNGLSPANTTITLEGTPVPPQIATETAQAAADRAEGVVAQSLTVSGAELTTTIDAETLRGWIHLDEMGPGQWQLFIESDPIAQFAANYARETDIAPVNASFKFKGGGIDVVPSQLGRATDVETTANSIYAALEARANGSGPSSVNLALVPVEPTLATAEAQQLAGRVKRLSRWTTNFNPGPTNGDGVNIAIPTSIIDGYAVEPGAQFDFLSVIGPITSPPYVTGGALIHGRIREDGAIGGGMCSCSTTIFNAALRFGLQIDTRYNHSIYISRYPVGLDATVWMAGPNNRHTMAFTNDTDYPILIRGINGHGEVTFELWGIDDGRTVEFSEPRIENLKESWTEMEYTNELAPGVRQRIEDEYDAFESWVTRTVRDRAGNVIHEDRFYSKYKMIKGYILVGRYPGDPKAGTVIRAENYPGPPNNPPPPAAEPEPEPPPTN